MRIEKILRNNVIRPSILRHRTYDKTTDNTVKRYYVDKEELQKGNLVQVSETEEIPNAYYWDQYKLAKRWSV